MTLTAGLGTVSAPETHALGTGFVAPFTVTIGCPGTPLISGGGTQVTGLMVPANGGTGLPIVIASGELPPQTLSQTFRYSAVGNTSGSSGGGCTSADSPATFGWLLLAGLLMLGAARATRRRA